MSVLGKGTLLKPHIRCFKGYAVKRPSSLLACRYADALLDLADAANQRDVVADTVARLRGAFASESGAAAMLAHPSLRGPAGMQCVDDLAVRYSLNPLVVNFLRVIAHNGRLRNLVDILEALNAEIERRNGVAPAYVRSAQALSDAQKKDLTLALSSMTGQTIDLVLETDPALLGGMVVRVGSTLFDGSVRSKLDRLKRDMLKAA